MSEEVLRVYQFDVDWFVAASEADAMKAFREHYVTNVRALNDAECDEQLEDGCVELPDDHVLGIIHDEKGQVSDSGEVIRKTCAEWAREHGRGFLCTSEL